MMRNNVDIRERFNKEFNLERLCKRCSKWKSILKFPREVNESYNLKRFQHDHHDINASVKSLKKYKYDIRCKECYES